MIADNIPVQPVPVLISQADLSAYHAATRSSVRFNLEVLRADRERAARRFNDSARHHSGGPIR